MVVSGCQAHLLLVLCWHMVCRVWDKRENASEREKIDRKLLELRGLTFIFVFQATYSITCIE